MNECLKLQRLLKVYGGGSLNKKFKGTIVNQGNRKPSNGYESSRGPSEPNLKSQHAFAKTTSDDHFNEDQVNQLVEENTLLREELEELKEKLASSQVDKTLELQPTDRSKIGVEQLEKRVEEIKTQSEHKVQEITSVLEDALREKDEHHTNSQKLDEECKKLRE